ALGIMIFMTQMPYLIGGSVMTYVFAIVTFLLVYLIPRYVRLIPAPLIAIIVMTSIAFVSGVKLQTIGDLGTMPNTLQTFFFADIPFYLQSLEIILPLFLSLSVVGLLQ